ncbi:hypothetical protein SCLCIDRAFT_1216123 [Scleroderma citrinum Foug A]|uniref:Uncharacterized protein n=1 Tax=Scleroderma citrinum Foug A TaxID=1036808 RepID=A0A0C3DYE2_9AGAM|nr:hypothetical protein SCLCIDRAFT_1216123 [Scleroderma citrinum Foug A]
MAGFAVCGSRSLPGACSNLSASRNLRQSVAPELRSTTSRFTHFHNADTVERFFRYQDILSRKDGTSHASECERLLASLQ